MDDGSSLFQLPDEALFGPLIDRFPCRESQIRTLAAFISPLAAPCSNIVIHGTEATSKSTLTAALLTALTIAANDPAVPAHLPRLNHTIVNCAQCVTARHLYERTVAAVASALGWGVPPHRCESLAQMAVDLQRLIELPSPLRPLPKEDVFDSTARDRFVLVLDDVDRQREAPHTLLPGLARLTEMIPALTIVYIVTAPPPGMLRIASVAPHVHFPAYSKAEFMRIMAATTVPPPISPPTPPSSSPSSRSPSPLTTAQPDQATVELWSRFCGAVHDTLSRPAARTLPALQTACRALWPRFTAPIRAGDLGLRDFSRLMIAARVHFHDESLLCPSIIAIRPNSDSPQPPPPPPTTTTTTPTPSTPKKPLASPWKATTPSRTPTAQTPTRTPLPLLTTAPELATLLPRTARLVLLASYLASHNAAKHDLTLFSTHHHSKRRRRGGAIAGRSRASAGKHRKIARRLLGAQAFVLERMVAIFAAVRVEWVGTDDAEAGSGDLDTDVAMAVSTLASLRLLVRVGGANADVMDRGGKWRINVGWDMVRALGRSMGVEMEDWLIE